MGESGMMFATIEDDRIAGIFCGDISKYPGAVALPDNFQGVVGQHIGEFNPDWSIRHLSERVAERLVTLPPGLKVKDEEIGPMTDVELIEGGLAQLPEGMVIDGETIRGMEPLERIKAGIDPVPPHMVLEGDALRPKTDEELIASNVITLEDWIEYRCDMIDAEWSRRLKVGFTYSDGNTYPLDDGAQIAYHKAYTMVREVQLQAPYARTVDNRNIPFTPEAFIPFAVFAFKSGDILQRARSDAKDALRACTTYEAALDMFNNYMGVL
jgi:hypothetical protein